MNIISDSPVDTMKAKKLSGGYGSYEIKERAKKNEERDAKKQALPS